MKKFFTVILCILIAIWLIMAVCFGLNELNRGQMEAYIAGFEPVEYVNRLVPELDEDGVPYFTTDGDFKVMHLTDVHICGGFISAANDKKALNAVAAMITAEKPDLVVVTGDIAFAVPWSGTLNNKYAHSYLASLMERLGVYYTVAFGNHDSEGYNYYNRAAVADMYEDESLKYSLFSSGSDDVFGECNHVINVKNSKGLITQSLIVIDTNAYLENDPLGILWSYDNIHNDQIEWYKDTVEKYSAQNKAVYESLAVGEKPENAEDFLTVKSLLFMHIPLMEVREAYAEYVNNNSQNTDNVKYIRGNAGETDKIVYCSEIEENMFETILELGSTEALFYGHDHLNNFVLEYKGVTLSYGYSIDYNAYSGIADKGYQRGCSVINCSPDTSFEITHENYYQDKYPSRYEKEVVDMTK